MKQDKLLTVITVFFMAVSAMLLALTTAMSSSLFGAIDNLMNQAQVADYMQMHMGELNEEAISEFAKNRTEVRNWQICRFLNLENSRLSLGDSSLADSTQDNGLCVQGQHFDYLLDMENQCPEVLQGEVYIPVCYRAQYNLKVGDSMTIGSQKLVIAGFFRDAQMNSMMASSKRFLVNEKDYQRIAPQGSEEYLIEFSLKQGANLDAFATAYTAEGLPSNGPTITKPLIRMMNALSDGMMILVIFLVSLVVLLISMLCIYYILSHRMTKDRKEVGLLKALGVGKREIRGLYFSKYVVLSLCGALIGLLSACLLKDPLARHIQELYGKTDTGMQTMIWAFFAVLLAEGIILFFIWHWLKQTEKLSALEALFCVQNHRRTMAGYLPIAIAVATCTFLMLVPQNLYSTMASPKFVTYMGIGNGEIRMDVRQTEDIEQVTRQLADMLEKDEGVAKYSVLLTKSYPAVLSDGSRVNLTVETGNHNIFPVSYAKGRVPEAEREIALSALNAQELGVTVGDVLSLVINGEKINYQVSGIYSDITNGGKTGKIGVVQDDTPAIWSVLYVSLHHGVEKGQWIEQYRTLGADVIDIEQYVGGTYGQTLKQIQLAAKVAVIIAALVIFVVIVLFMQLIVEKDRYTISLYKALGFTYRDVKRSYLTSGMFHAVMGVVGGITIGSLCGEGLCGMLLKSFGADGFQFVIRWERVLIMIPAISILTAGLAVLTGTGEILRIKASECCVGKE